MANESKTTGGLVTEDLMERTRGLFAAAPLNEPQMEQFWKAQDAILEETEAFSKAWFERRHEATRQAVEAVHKLNGEGGGGADPTAAMRAMAEWQQGSLRRMAQDMQEWVELCSRCAARVTDAEVEAGKKGAEKLAKSAKSKHATPV
ncbi:MAG: hypothetical protein HLUCCO18_09430 [Rhodobacteraceae bacterium HLUCCO18]|nr:MAG: hypothetical protein HLUCCO18_09430 [Rhodobacteraceae bacterium HLUCCO18]